MTRIIRLLCLFTVALAAAARADEPRTWRVFLLSGQSNMQGKGSIKHLEQLATDPNTADEYKHLRGGDGWVKRRDVLIRFVDGGDANMAGPLAPGYARPENRFGPELGFGHVVGEALDEQVVIIKVAWGGRSLRFDVRPPSSGKGDFEPKWLRRMADRKKYTGDPNDMPGHSYRQLVRLTHETLAHLGEHFPSYKGQPVELSAFVWFQGWNDMLDGSRHAEYGPNLANLLRDLRKDLGVADLPMVVGELGQSGPAERINKRYRAKHLSFRSQQASVSKMPEFAGQVAYVPTHPYVVFDGPQFDGGYHYRGRADTFYHIGQAFGRAVLPLLDKKPSDDRKSISAAREQAVKRYAAPSP